MGTNYQYPPDVITGTFTAAGQVSPSVQFAQEFSVCLGGSFTATVLIERSPDQGATFYPCSTDATGSIAAYTAPMTVDVMSSRHAMLYRLRCTAYASGTVSWTLWQ